MDDRCCLESESLKLVGKANVVGNSSLKKIFLLFPKNYTNLFFIFHKYYKKLTLSLNNDKLKKGHCQRNDPKIPDLIYHCFVSMVQLGNVQ